MAKNEPMASKADRAHFAAIGEVEQESEEWRIERALRTPPGERILEGIRLGVALPLSAEVRVELESLADGQIELARRGRLLAERRRSPR